MEEDLRAVLLGSSAVTDLAGMRINFGSHPQGAVLPGAVLTVIDGVEGMTYKGPDGLQTARVQIDCYGVTYLAAKTLARAVIALLHGYKDTAFLGVFHLSSRDSREGASNEADRPFRTSLDFMTHWRATP
jgi:hypothetical protein